MLSHSAFVLLSYGAAAAVLGAVLVWLFIDRAATMAELDRLEQAGLKRRSASGGDESR
ncbi:MAG: heme exporter protein CcmD [Roseitalea sp.]|jgi:heme exporter protein D|uniref:Heme exporter protein D n=1 Tax=Oceaniradius stylonematis TaxID=2184161 RepID=A0A3A8AAT6_9HYPH|nr:heme exporter protein CcmD [Oceaniradius stylonematis]MBO6554704.1 heme exporter protein CcmD [Roseitalea sp.]MBO6953727.1 heme exporter protein CcmD [Rhizobiaceae bacterium]RNC96797.1 MAG: heme exporter protein CcmD [Oricola sp.]MBO6594076.1 heme exporter protein CcmD [Roseitalea sp.]MBO6601491.1 heme exporter protein CcmD [Roseitalea sp.]